MRVLIVGCGYVGLSLGADAGAERMTWALTRRAGVLRFRAATPLPLPVLAR